MVKSIIEKSESLVQKVGKQFAMTLFNLAQPEDTDLIIFDNTKSSIRTKTEILDFVQNGSCFSKGQILKPPIKLTQALICLSVHQSLSQLLPQLSDNLVI